MSSRASKIGKQNSVEHALRGCAKAYAKVLKQAIADGEITVDDAPGVATASIMRAIDRITELPDEMDRDEHFDQLQAALLQVYVASSWLLENLPFSGLLVQVVGFNVDRKKAH